MNWRKPIIFLLLYLSGNKIPAYLNEIERISDFSKEERKKYQDKKLKKLLLHSWKNVSYYSKILESTGVVKEGVVFLENFHKIPLLTKEIIRREGKNLYSIDYEKRKIYENTSGGSTGEPVRFIQDKEHDEWNKATKIYYKQTAGQQIGDKELRLWGSERDLLEGLFEGKEKLSRRMRNWLYNRKEFSTYRISDEEMKRYFDVWNKFKPTWVESYASSMFEFSKFLKKNRMKVNAPIGVLTGAVTLYPEMKELIQEVIGRSVYNRYGSREVGDMACGRDSLAISYWRNKVEIVGDNGKESKKGNVIVTGLNNYSMPLIRYEIGDVGTISEDGFELEEVQGKAMCYFKKRNGERVTGGFFSRFLYFKDWCKKFQVIQRDFDLIEIKFVGQKNERGFSEIKKGIKEIMGEDCNIKFTVVDEILPSKSGKFFYTISEI